MRFTKTYIEQLSAGISPLKIKAALTDQLEKLEELPKVSEDTRAAIMEMKALLINLEHTEEQKMAM